MLQPRILPSSHLITLARWWRRAEGSRSITLVSKCVSEDQISSSTLQEQSDLNTVPERMWSLLLFCNTTNQLWCSATFFFLPVAQMFFLKFLRTVFNVKRGFALIKSTSTNAIFLILKVISVASLQRSQTIRRGSADEAFLSETIHHGFLFRKLCGWRTWQNRAR